MLQASKIRILPPFALLAVSIAIGQSGYDIANFAQPTQADDGVTSQPTAGGFDGRLRHSYTMSVPPGRGPTTPDVELSYSSDGGNDWCGVGWSLGAGAIERDSKEGVPVQFDAVTGDCLDAYDDDQGFRFGGQKLISVGANVWRPEVDQGGAYLRFERSGDGWLCVNKSGTKTYFGSNAQSRLSNADWGTSGSAWSRTARWHVSSRVDSNGNYADYEYDSLTYQHASSSGTGGTGHVGVGMYLSKIRYNGNQVTGTPTTHEVAFEREPRSASGGTDIVTTFRAGIREELHERLKNVRFRILGQHTSRYALSYVQSPSTGKSLLSSVQIVGSDDVSTRPATTFEYSTHDLAFDAPQVWGPLKHQQNAGAATEQLRSWNSLRTRVTADPLYPNGARSIVEFMDMNRDGLPDRVLTDREGAPDRYLVQHMRPMSAGGGFEQTLVSYPFTAPSSFAITRGSLGFNINDSTINGILNGVSGLVVTDINGDGFPDRVHNAQYQSAAWPSDMLRVEFGSASGFSSVTPFGPIDWYQDTGLLTWVNRHNSLETTFPYGEGFVGQGQGHLVGAQVVGFRDINGDGRPDRVMRDPSVLVSPRDSFRVQINTGTGFGPKQTWEWDDQYEPQGNTAAYWHNVATYDPGNISAPHAHTSVDLIDINGDGLPDRVMKKGPGPANSYTDLIVQFNKGYGFTAWESWGPITHPDFPGSGSYGSVSDAASGAYVPVASGSPTPAVYVDAKTSMLMDVNGDGLVDRVMHRVTSPVTQDRFSVQINTGAGFGAPVDYTGAQLNWPGEAYPSTGYGPMHYPTSSEFRYENGFYPVVATRSQLMDVNGDGLADRVLSVNAAPQDQGLRVQLAQGTRPDLLVVTRNGLGSSTEVEYAPAALVDTMPTINGVSAQPFGKLVVTSTTTFDGFNANGLVTSYAYAGGAYDFDRREPCGFYRVRTTGPSGIQSETYYHQGGAHDGTSLGEWQDDGRFWKKGMPFLVRTYDRNGALATERVDKVAEHTTNGQAGSHYFPYVQQSINTTYTRPGGNQVRVSTATTNAYDIVNRNALITSYLGRVSVSSTMPHAITAQLPDIHGEIRTRIATTTYATLQNDILDRPASIKTETTTPTGQAVSTYQERDYWSSNGNLREQRSYWSYPPSSANFARTRTWYLPNGLPDEVEDADGTFTSFVHDAPLQTFVESMTIDPVGPSNSTGVHLETITENDPATGRMMSVTHPSGMREYSVLDVFGRVTESHLVGVNGVDTWTSKVEYNEGDVSTGGPSVFYTVRKTNDGTGPNGTAAYTYLDGLGRPLQLRSQGETGRFRVVDTRYDDNGQLAFETKPHLKNGSAWSATPGPLRVTYGYDRLMRVDRVTPPSPETGSPTAPTVTIHEYQEPNGQPWPFGTTAYDADGKVVRTHVDVFQQVARIMEGSGAETSTLNVFYTERGEEHRVVDDSGAETVFEYDLLGRQTQVDHPDTGVATVTYYPGGNVKDRTSNRGTLAKNFYDAAGRPVLIATFLPGAVLDSVVRYRYDVSANPNLVVRKGDLALISDDEGWLEFGYDTFGRTTVTRRHLYKIQKTYRSVRTYTSEGKLLTQQYPFNRLKVEYRYLPGGALDEIRSLTKIEGQYPVFFKALAYDNEGSLLSARYGNGVDVTHERYANSGRLKRLRATLGPATLQDLSYGYWASGRMASMTDASTTKPTSFANVAYDSIGRLKSYLDPAGQSYQFDYDGTGNILENDECGTGPSSTYTYNSLRPHAVESAPGLGYTYDLNGNVLTRVTPAGTQTLQYDARDKVTQISGAGQTVTFGYSHNGRRLWKKFGGDTSVYIGRKFEVKGGEQICHLVAGGMRVCSVVTPVGDAIQSTSGGQSGSDTSQPPVVYYYHENHLSSSHVNTDSTGAEVERTSFRAFGTDRHAATGTTFTPSFLFTNQLKDDETGLYWYERRFYDPQLGRFLQPDSMRPFPLDTQGQNPYTYVRNNPLMLVDPTGNYAVGGPGDWLGWVVKKGRAGLHSAGKFSAGALDSATFGYSTTLAVNIVATAMDVVGDPPTEAQKRHVTAIIKGSPEHTTGEVFGTAAQITTGVGALKKGTERLVRANADEAIEILIDGTLAIARPAPVAVSGVITSTEAAGLVLIGGNLAIDDVGPDTTRIAFSDKDPLIGGSAEAARVEAGLNGAASSALKQAGAGKGPVYGTKVHTIFENEVNRLGLQGLATEVSFLRGSIVARGTKGSVRLDTVLFGSNGTIRAIWDLKTGRARLTARRIRQIRGHLPAGTGNILIRPIR